MRACITASLFLRQLACTGLVLSAGLAIEHGQLHAAEATARADAQLPLVIPHPQAIRRAGDERLILAENGQITAQIALRGQDPFLAEARDLIQGRLKQKGFAGSAGHAGAGATEIVMLSVGPAAADASADRSRPLVLTPAEEKALKRSDQAYVVRMKPGAQAKVFVVGASPLGVYYGATTLAQLIEADRFGRAAVGNIEVHDYPDMPYRMCADWVLTWDWETNGYDWGDGLEAFIARVKRKIDLCSRYKINMVRFLGGRIAPGTASSQKRYEMIRRFAPELNRYARRKGVALQYSAVSWGTDYYGWGLPCAEPWILNRQSYPDGKVYSCFAGTTGSCMSNETLNAIIAKRYTQLVRELEPGSIYLHHADVAAYTECAALWKQRCGNCRRRFPDDELFAPRGLAGAVAHLYGTIVAELKSVRNPQSGYDASRDLRIVFASPGYAYAGESDADWDKQLAYWAEVGRQLQDKRNVHVTFRELFKRLDNNRLRIEELDRRMTGTGWPESLFVFAAQGGDLMISRNMLVSSPVLTETFRGAGILYNFNGHVHNEAQALANVDYAWNHHAPGWVDPGPLGAKELLAEAQRYFAGAKHSDFLYGRFLETACADLYGPAAAPAMAAMFRLERDQGVILPVLCWIDPLPESALAGYDWQGQARRNLQAKAMVDRAAAVCAPEAKEDLAWLSKCLDATARVYGLYHAVFREKLSPQQIDGQAASLSAWLDKSFQFEKTEPDGGDLGSWKSCVARARQFSVPKP